MQQLSTHASELGCSTRRKRANPMSVSFLSMLHGARLSTASDLGALPLSLQWYSRRFLRDEGSGQE